MAKELRSISLGAAGFNGLNTMDSPLQVNVDFADTANNAVIDNYGRLAARKGFSTLSDDISGLNLNSLRAIGELVDEDGTKVLFGAGNDKLWRIDTTTTTHDTLTEMTTTTFMDGTDEYQFVPFNDELHVFSPGDTYPGFTNKTLNATDSFDDYPFTAPKAGFGMGAYGRMWATKVFGEPNMVYWSALLDADDFVGGDAGSIDLQDVWPSGRDEVVALAYHNNRLIIFGKNSFVVYSGADTPATMTLEDTVIGVGCAFSDSVQYTGNDVIWCSYSGIKSLSRTVLQNSMPEGDLTKNIRKNIQSHILAETTGVKSTFSQSEMCYLITFEDAETTYYLDFKSELQDGTRKCTIWPSSPFTCLFEDTEQNVWCGGLPGFGQYTGYQDDGGSYRLQYYGPAFDFGDASRTKVLKRITPTLVGGTSTEVTVYWGYGFGGSYSSEVLSLIGGDTIAEYGLAQFNINYYTGEINIVDESVNTTGSGEVVRIGIGADINGSELSIQQVRVQCILGRIV